VLIVHGEQDDVVLPQRSQEAEGTLRDAGVAVESHYIPGLPHGIDDTGVALGAAFLRRAFTTGV
jgi:phospholipase/carboxylesterase